RSLLYEAHLIANNCAFYHAVPIRLDQDMTFVGLLRDILRDNPGGLTPQQPRDIIKARAPEFYDTESHRRNVERGNYSDLDHALLAHIYVAARNCSDINIDRTQKPQVLSIVHTPGVENIANDDTIESE